MKFYLVENIHIQLVLARSNSYQETGYAMLRTPNSVIYHRHRDSPIYRESLAFGNLSNFWQIWWTQFVDMATALRAMKFTLSHLMS